MKDNKRFYFSVTMIVVMVLSLALFGNTGRNVSAAPANSPNLAMTDIGYDNSNNGAALFTFKDGAITTSQYFCQDMSKFDVLELQWSIDQGTTNTNTVTIVYSSIAGVYEAGGAENVVVTANAADAHGAGIYKTHLRYTCVYISLANANSLGVKFYGVGK